MGILPPTWMRRRHTLPCPLPLLQIPTIRQFPPWFGPPSLKSTTLFLAYPPSLVTDNRHSPLPSNRYPLIKLKIIGLVRPSPAMGRVHKAYPPTSNVEFLPYSIPVLADTSLSFSMHIRQKNVANLVFSPTPPLLFGGYPALSVQVLQWAGSTGNTPPYLKSRVFILFHPRPSPF